MCQKDFKKVKGEICIDSQNQVFFISDPYRVNSFEKIARNITFSTFQEYALFLLDIGALKPSTSISICDVPTLIALWEEFNEMKFNEGLSAIMNENGIIPEELPATTVENRRHWLMDLIRKK